MHSARFVNLRIVFQREPLELMHVVLALRCLRPLRAERLLPSPLVHLRVPKHLGWVVQAIQIPKSAACVASGSSRDVGGTLRKGQNSSCVAVAMRCNLSMTYWTHDCDRSFC